MTTRRILAGALACSLLWACARGTDPRDNVDGGLRSDRVTPPGDTGTGACTPGETQPCYSSDPGTRGVGACRDGTQTCGADGQWGHCTGEVTPRAMEVCGNAQDDDCNGMVDDACGACTPGESRMCYSGPAGTAGQGICREGMQSCTTTRMWGPCAGEVLPQPAETCGNGRDDDCNGMVDDACGSCTPGTTRMCYSGPAGTEGRGICTGGTQVCTPSREWATACTGEVLPQPAETCGNGRDDDCDGMIDEGCGVCTPGMMRTCYTGPAGTAGVGICRNGSQTCDASGNWPSTCSGEVLPRASETCGNGQDDNCNGTSDEGCTTAPANDNRSSASTISLTAGEATVTGTTAGATHDGPSPCGCTSGGNVWYRFTLSQREVVYADTAGTGFDTSLQIVDSSGLAVSGMCNDDAYCTSGGFTASTQSRVAGVLGAGTYYLGVGGCGSGSFTLHVQHIPTSVGSFFFSTALTGTGTTASTTLMGSSAQTSMCGGSASGEDVRWFVTCGAQQQFFSLCQSDGGSFVRRSGTTNYDPVIYLRSGITGGEVSCNDDGTSMGGTNCQGTGGDTLNYGSRLNNVTVGRGIHVVIVDELIGGSGMSYTMRYTVR
jgi:hypothetical protein